MAQTFRIATSSKLEGFFLLGDKNKVSEDFFWQTFDNKLKEITASQPDKYEEVKENATNTVKKSSLTILDTWFEIKGKP